MRNNMTSKRSIRGVAQGALIVVLSALLAAMAIVLTLFHVPATKASAESAGSVTIHVYDPAKSYAKMGAWVWLKGGSGKPYTDIKQDANEEFKKEDNRAISITAPLTGDEVAKLKGGTKLGFLICSPTFTGSSVWGDYKKETPDVFVDMMTAFDSSNHAHVYYVRKDTEAYTTLEEGKMALEKVTSARFTSKTGGLSVEFESTISINANTVMELYDGDDRVATANAKPKTQYSGSVKFTGVTFKFTSVYTLKVQGVPKGATVSMTAFIDDTEFIKVYENEETQELEFGAVVDQKTGAVTFRVWAPFAVSVKLNIYDNGTSGEALRKYDMYKRFGNNTVWGGVWEYIINSGAIGRYYTYTVNNGGQDTETIDPYAKACGVNGNRGMVVDLSATDPEGWENDKHLYAMSGKPAGKSLSYATLADTPIIWEVQVKDFSVSPDSGMKYKGKYLAFTEEDTTVPGKPNLKTGVNYLKDLGITYVHLNPVYDFVTVDESDASLADDTKDTYNWGYDPQNYNIPEGSYSTDPTHGEVRIKEFKQMVMALHKAGIGVIMDVVYNHTYATSGQALNDTVPKYYHRTLADGSFSDDSGCSNGTASERTMMRKYMIESLRYWATEYHIDGFRFDLMGIHDVRTLNMIRAELDSLNGGSGTKLLMYGEPWSADGNFIPQSFKDRLAVTSKAIPGTGKYTSNANNGLNNKVNSLFKIHKNEDWEYQIADEIKDRIAIFGDTGRDGLRGNNDLGPSWSKGWANGNPDNLPKVQKMLEGYCGSIGKGISSNSGSQCIAYASAHDNYTLWDQMFGKEMGKETPLYFENYIDDIGKQCKLVAGAYLMSNGVPFMLAGEEMGRTKYGNHNSYNSVPKLNQIVWSRQENFKSLVDFYKACIKIRLNNNAAFSYAGSVNKANCYYNFDGSDNGVLVATHSKNNKIQIVLDANTKTGYVTDGTTTARV